MPKKMNRDATLASAKTRFLKNRIGSIGSVTRSSHRMNSANTTAPAISAVTISAEAPDDPGQTGTCERYTRQIELGRRPVRLVEAAERKRHQDDADRDVEPEDPVPGDAAHYGATDDGPKCDSQTGDAAPRA